MGCEREEREKEDSKRVEKREMRRNTDEKRDRDEKRWRFEEKKEQICNSRIFCGPKILN